MYEALVARIRYQIQKANFMGLKEAESTLLLGEAADAIELLQTYKVVFENIISMGGWWLVGQDKNLYRMDVPMNWPPNGTKTVELFPLPQPPKEE